MRIISVVGTRPNFIKIAPFIKAIDNHNLKSSNFIEHFLVHTGQHYDDSMSGAFFKQLDIPDADINLNIGSGTHAEQIGTTMIKFEKVIHKIKPQWIVVVGDVNSSLACSVTAKKENLLCCHIEAGLRSNDMSMPEEINRLVIDSISDLHLTSDPFSGKNLMKQGIADNKVIFTGNIMIDSLENNRSKAESLVIEDIIHKHTINGSLNNFKSLNSGDFAVMTMHRPSNVDIKSTIEPILRFILDDVCERQPLIWPIHPRTKKMLKTFGLLNEIIAHKNLIALEPLGYLEMLKLNMSANIMITDSGGLQEECTILGTPFLSLRTNTERPVTLYENGGSGVLVGNNIEKIRNEYHKMRNTPRRPVRPELWDGHTAERCLKAILDYNPS